jgi:hypothetical protein
LLGVQVTQVVAIQGDLPGGGVIKPQEQLEQGGFAGSAGTDDGGGLAG